jgi:hypothetical protein
MTLQIPIQEAISLIKDKSGKDVSLKIVDRNTINHFVRRDRGRTDRRGGDYQDGRIQMG